MAQLILMAVCLSGALGSLLTSVNGAVYESVLNLFLRLTGGV